MGALIPNFPLIRELQGWNPGSSRDEEGPGEKAFGLLSVEGEGRIDLVEGSWRCVCCLDGKKCP